MADVFPDKPQNINDKDFEVFVKKYPLAVVDCWAGWCIPCRIIAPVLEEMAKKFNGKIAFGKIEIDKNQETARKYAVMSIPTLLVFRNGEHIDTIVGALPKQALEPKLSAYVE